MILLCGIRSEPPLARVATELERIGADTAWFDQRQALDTYLDVTLADGTASGRLRTPDAEIDLASVRAVYIRTMDDRLLPEVESLAADAPERLHVRTIHDRLLAWLAVSTVLVVNSPEAQATNAAKPHQLRLIADAGFGIPETLITNDAAEVVRFRDRHRRVVYKSISGERSIVSPLTDLDLERLDRLRLCPVQFQAWVPGPDVRVHVVGGETFASRVQTSATDYRYPARSGALAPAITPFELRDDLADRCVEVTRELGLELAGIDLRMAEPDGQPICLEVNPSPAFTYYEMAAGLPIAAAVARHLAVAPGAG